MVVSRGLFILLTLGSGSSPFLFLPSLIVGGVPEPTNVFFHRKKIK